MTQFSKEVNALVQYFHDSGAPGVITDINTVGVHAKNSDHYKEGTDGTGLAIDSGFRPRQVDSNGLLEQFHMFAVQWKNLDELFYSGAPFYVKNGNKYDIKFLDPSVKAAHHDHNHVSVRKGTFLKWNGAPATPVVTTPPKTEDDSVADKFTIEYDGGTKKTSTNEKGEVFCARTPFYGGVPNMPPQDKQGFEKVLQIVKLDPNDPVKGYTLQNQAGQYFDFTPEYAEKLKKLKLL